jgi:electron transfer flavoprotein beta subunit
MRSIVCVKQVIDTEAVITLEGTGEVIREGQTMVIDPYSEFSVERAVQLKEEQGGEVTLLCLGDQECLSAVRHGLAMGADDAILIEDDNWFNRTPSFVAAALAAVIKDREADFVMGGWKSGDTAHAQVMGRVAALLHLPYATMVTHLDVEGSAVTCTCEVDDGLEVVEIPLPAVVAAQQGLAEPRYPSVRDVMQARRKKPEILPIDSLDFPHESRAQVRVVERALKPARTGGRVLEGEVTEVVAETARLLVEEAQVL